MTETELRIPDTKGKSNLYYFLHPTKFGKFCFCLQWLQKRCTYATRFRSGIQLFSLEALFRGCEDEMNFSKSPKVWES